MSMVVLCSTLWESILVTYHRALAVWLESFNENGTRWLMVGSIMQGMED